MPENRRPLRCIGGPWDGKVVLLPENQGYLHVAESGVAAQLRNYADPQAVPVVKQHRYRVEAIAANHRVFRILVEEALTVDDALDRLILCYTPRFT